MGVNSGRTTTTPKIRDETVEKLEESVEENIDIDEELDDFSFQIEEDSNDDVGLQIEERKSLIFLKKLRLTILHQETCITEK